MSGEKQYRPVEASALLDGGIAYPAWKAAAPHAVPRRASTDRRANCVRAVRRRPDGDHRHGEEDGCGWLGAHIAERRRRERYTSYQFECRTSATWPRYLHPRHPAIELRAGPVPRP